MITLKDSNLKKMHILILNVRSEKQMKEKFEYFILITCTKHFIWHYTYSHADWWYGGYP